MGRLNMYMPGTAVGMTGGRGDICECKVTVFFFIGQIFC